ncbi:hypothetical protein D9756_006490 [Leucocoprinus leucothites]|uniref:Cytochrome P450 n=1 Tax=Leucocoprinus leucothites TaxID=201217 RepID=A0A8H5G2X0_9AGAR|nr:hypothetical protein D9756_006490 [Leucoagaricus leucothites]
MQEQILRILKLPPSLWVVALPFLAACTKVVLNRALLLWKHLPRGPSFLSRWWSEWKNNEMLPTKLMRWGNIYGGVMSIMDLVHFGKPTIVLCNPKAAMDLLEKRGNLYSSRPRNIIASEICYGGFKGTLYQSGIKLKRFRTLMNATMNADASRKYRPLEDAESKLLLRDLLEASPNNYKLHVQRVVHSVAMYTAYGLRMDRLDQDHAEFFGNVEKYFRGNVLPGRYLVDHFPILLYLPRPLQWFRKVAEEQGKVERFFFLHCLSQTRMVVDKGQSAGVSAARALEKQETYGYSDAEIAINSSAPYTAGVMTTYASFEIFVLAMLLYPQVMKQAQKDIDSVVGRERLPGFEDIDSLPYIRALIKEIGRWHPPAPLGLPHAADEDDVYEGMFIPAGSTVLANIYAITRNTELFPDPEEFRPERFVDNDDPFFKNYNATFGFGRRICPGQHIATDELFALITRILWAFDIVSQEDEFDPLKHRVPSNPRFGMVPSLPYKLVPREDTVRSIIVEEALLAEREVQAWESFSFKKLTVA